MSTDVKITKKQIGENIVDEALPPSDAIRYTKSLLQDDKQIIDTGGEYRDNYTGKSTGQYGGINAYMNDVGDHDILSSSEEREIASLITNSRDVMRSIVTSTLFAAEQFLEIADNIDETRLKDVLAIPTSEKMNDEKREQYRQDVKTAKNKIVQYISRYKDAYENQENDGYLKWGSKISSAIENIGLDQDYINEMIDSYKKNEESFLSGVDHRAIKVALSGVDTYYRYYHNKMMSHNLRLVVSIARRYQNGSLDIMDLVQEGNIGLAKAIDRFDPELGYKLSTYATWWIRQAMTRAITEQSGSVNVPVHVKEKINRIHSAARRLIMRNGEEPEQDELAEELGWDVETVQYFMRVERDPVSLNKPLDDEDDGSMTEVIENPNADTPDSGVANEALREKIQKLLADLTYRQQQIVRMRYGLDSGEEHTLQELGKRFDITRERVRQIEEEALGIMREQSDDLALFLEEIS